MQNEQINSTETLNKTKSKRAKTVLSGTITVAVLTVLYRILGFLRESVTAAYLGNTATSDAYYIAYSIPYTIINVIALGAIASAAIPFLSGFLDKRDVKGLSQFVNNTTSLMLPFLIVVCALSFIFSDKIVQLLAPGLNPETNALATDLTRNMILMMLPMGLSGIFTALTTANKNFSVEPGISLIFNGVLIAGGLLAYRFQNLYILTYSVMIASVIRFILSVVCANKFTGISIRLQYKPMNPNVKIMLIAMLPICVSLIINSSSQIIGRAVASGLDEGSITSLNYAEKIFRLPYGIIIGSVASVLLPFLSEFINENKEEKVAEMYQKCINALFIIIIPIMLLMIFLNEPIIRVVFEHGNFTARDTVRTARTLIFYALALPGSMVVDINSRIFYAYKETKLPLVITICVLAINFCLCFLLSPAMDQDGIALAFAISMTIGAFIGRIIIIRLHKALKMPMQYKFMGKLIICALLFAFFTYIVSNFLIGNIIEVTGSVVGIVQVLAICLILLILYLIVLDIFKVFNVKKYIIKFKNKLLKRA